MLKWVSNKDKVKEPFKYSRHTRALYGAELIDAYRIVPRTILVAYGMLVFWIIDWFLRMPDPTTQQTALATTITGTVAAVIGLYQHTGRSWEAHGTQMMPMPNPYINMPMMMPPMMGAGRQYPTGTAGPIGETYGEDE